MSQNGKGDDLRPCFVEREVVGNNYDKTFNKKQHLPKEIVIYSKEEYEKYKKEYIRLKEYNPLSFSYKAKKMVLIAKALENYEINQMLDITSSISECQKETHKTLESISEKNLSEKK